MNNSELVVSISGSIPTTSKISGGRKVNCFHRPSFGGTVRNHVIDIFLLSLVCVSTQSFPALWVSPKLQNKELFYLSLVSLDSSIHRCSVEKTGSLSQMSTRKKRKVLFCGGETGGDGDGDGEGDDRGGSGLDKQETEAFSRDEGSQISISDGILPSLGVTARSCRRITLRRFIISPFNPRYRFQLIF